MTLDLWLLLVLVLIFNSPTLVYARHMIHRQSSSSYSIEPDLKEAQDRQQKFLEQFNRMMSSIDDITAKLGSENNITNKISLLQKAILTERAQIASMSLGLVPNLNVSECDCQLTDAMKSSLVNQVSAVKSNLTALKNSMSKLNTCDRVDFMKSDIEREFSVIQIMQKTVGSTCQVKATPPPPAAPVTQSNLNAPNWILGSMTADQLVDEFYARLRNNSEIITCGLQTPFYDGQKCISCDGSAPVFNYSSKKCTACGQKQVLNKTARQCSNKVYQTNPIAPNILSSSTPTDDPSTENCPLDKPYYNGVECISCTGTANLFNLQTKKCSQCQPPQNYFATKYQCGTCAAGQVYNSTTKSCELDIKYTTNLDTPGLVGLNDSIDKMKANLSNQMSKNPGLKVCDASVPYWNGTNCIACISPQTLFNISSSKCTNCKSIQAYDSASRTCKVTTDISTNTTANITTNTGNNTGTNTGTGNNTSNNTKNNTSTNTSTNASTPTSAKFVSNLSNAKWIVKDQTSTAVYDRVNTALSDPQVQKCPQGKQFFDGVSCISCPSNNYFNFDSKKCESCPTGKVFDINVHSCLSQAPANTYQTNPSSPDLIYDGVPKIQYVNAYNANKTKYSDMKDCPVETPFFDGTNCIKCSSPFPYFNLDAKMCQKCGDSSKYDPNMRECYSTSGSIVTQGPTIQKMLAGIF